MGDGRDRKGREHSRQDQRRAPHPRVVADLVRTLEGEYVALILGSVALAGALIRDSDPRAWAAAGALALSVIVGYTLSRTTGLPQSSGDIGNWSEPLGIASLFVDGSVVAVSVLALLGRVPILGATREAYAQ